MSIEYFGGELLKVKFNSKLPCEVREFLKDYINMVDKLRLLGTYELYIAYDKSNKTCLKESLSSEDYDKAKSELLLFVEELKEISIYSHYNYIGGNSPGNIVSEMLNEKANIEFHNVDFFEYKSVLGYDVENLSDCYHFILENNMLIQKIPQFADGINFPELKEVKYWYTNNFDISFLHPDEFPEKECELLRELVDKIKELTDLEEEEDEAENQFGEEIRTQYFSMSAEIVGYDNVELFISYLREILNIQGAHSSGFLNITISFVLDDENLIADVQILAENNTLIVQSRIL